MASEYFAFGFRRTGLRAPEPESLGAFDSASGPGGEAYGLGGGWLKEGTGTSGMGEGVGGEGGGGVGATAGAGAAVAAE